MERVIQDTVRPELCPSLSWQQYLQPVESDCNHIMSSSLSAAILSSGLFFWNQLDEYSGIPMINQAEMLDIATKP